MIENVLAVLEGRFSRNTQRHPGLSWSDVATALESRKDLRNTLHAMEESGGEPDVVVLAHLPGIYLVDCASESPKGRRSLCYDKDARLGRKENPPKDSALEMAESMGLTILDETDYRALLTMGPVDQKTSSWILTPGDVRAFGGAVFMDYRYGRGFLYHNGADSYYGSRGFRGRVLIA